MTIRGLIEAANLRPIETAPRDGSYIIGVTRHDLDERWLGQAARPFVIWHMGRTQNLGYDMGWSLYPGMGVGDEWFAGWVPLPFDLDRAAILRAQSDAPSNLQKVHIAPDAPAWKGNDAFCASLRNVPENAFKHAPAPDAVEALVKADSPAVDAWIQAASTGLTGDLRQDVARGLNAALAAIRAGGKP